MVSAPRPDPQRGVFETLLVADGRPVELEGHLARLAASLGELYGANHTEEARRLIVEGSRGLALGRLRLTATPGAEPADGIGFSLGTEAVDANFVLHPGERPAALHTVTVPAGIGGHKWSDRSLLHELEKAIADRNEPVESLPLLVDENGAILETSRANLFAVVDGALVTPPADGRILPGTVRTRVLELARAAGIHISESSIPRDELLEATEVFLTGSIRGVVAAREIDGTELPSAGAVTRHVAEELRHRWLR